MNIWLRWVVSGLVLAVVFGAVSLGTATFLSTRLAYDYRTIDALSQGVGFLVAFLLMWPLALRRGQPFQHIPSFGRWAAYLMVSVGIVTVLRISLHLG